MPAIVRANADAHSGHSGYRVPFHKTYYTGGSGNVFINGEPVILKGNKCLCGDPAVGASGSVFVNGVPVHRKGDATGGHGNWVPNSASTGSPNVYADGGPSPGGFAQNAAEYTPSSAPGSSNVSGGAGFTAGPSPAGFLGTLDPDKFFVDNNGRVQVYANSGANYTYREVNGGYYLINLDSYEPIATKVDPIGPGGGISKTYDIPEIGVFDTAKFYTVEQFNPALAQFSNIPSKEERLALIAEYAAQQNISWMTNGDFGPSSPVYYESDAFKAFLESKGFGDNTEGG